MPKKKKREDEEVLQFALKLVGSLVVAIIVAVGIDISHALNALAKFYG